MAFDWFYDINIGVNIEVMLYMYCHWLCSTWYAIRRRYLGLLLYGAVLSVVSFNATRYIPGRRYIDVLLYCRLFPSVLYISVVLMYRSIALDYCHWFCCTLYKALRCTGGCGSPLRSLTSHKWEYNKMRMKRTERSTILGWNWPLANAESSMLQGKNPDAACMYEIERTERKSGVVSYGDWK